MRLDERWSPEPDVMVVLNAGVPRMGPHRLQGPADLVIEICSESDPELDYREKLPRYRSAQVPEIWVVDRFKKHVHVESSSGAARVLKGGRLNSTAVNGLWIDVDWLWQAKLPSTVQCLREILK